MDFGKMMLSAATVFVVATMGVAMVGCNGGGGLADMGDEEALWQMAEQMYYVHERQTADGYDEHNGSGFFSSQAGQIERTVNARQDAPQGLRDALTRVGELYGQLSNNPNDRSAQQEIEEYLSYFGEGELPPGY